MTSNEQSKLDPSSAAASINAALDSQNAESVASAINHVLSSSGERNMKVSGWMVSEGLSFLRKLGLRVRIEPLQ